MTLDLRQFGQSVQKPLQTLKKMLATELSILSRGNTGRPTKMRIQITEPSLFDTNGSRKYLNAAERTRFQDAMRHLPPRERVFCAVLLFSGGRVSEVLALTPAAIDLESGEIILRTLKRRRKGVVRQIPLPPALLCDLDDLFELGKARTDPLRQHRPVWTWSRSTAWRLVKKAMKEAQVIGVAASPKGLRHTFGVSAFQANVPPHLVQRWLGHASLRTTAIYADVSGNEEKQFAARMWRNSN
ncbi:tyrosine-type recombinase/integrase [uncultured Bradyrhizobium sp.]|uniref:tyrosine-type recombinase/integrase n=1 Tax=uncultured Bradyrhizobium sp. TaxID=199684 RepID=UPI0035CA1549